MPFSALFLVIASILVAGIFIYSLNRWGLKRALIFSLLASGIFFAIFVVILTITLNNM